MKSLKKDVKNIVYFITIYFLILIPLNFVPMIAAYGLEHLILSLNTMIMIEPFNIYTFITYCTASALSAGVAGYLLKTGKTAVEASIIIVTTIMICGVFLNGWLQFPLTAKLAVISIIFASALFGSHCHRLLENYNNFFNQNTKRLRG